MDKKEKIKAVGLAEEIEIAIKDIFVAQMQREGSEISLKFPNGQEFIAAVWEETEEIPVPEKYDSTKLSGEEYNQWFEIHQLNWIRSGIYLETGIKAEQKDNEVCVTLKTGQKYSITIQRK